MSLDSKQLELWYDQDEHQKIIAELTALKEEDLTYEFKLHLARAYNNESRWDDAIILLNQEKEIGEKEAFWNYIICYAYYQKGNFSEAEYEPENIDLQKEQVEFYEKADAYNKKGLSIDPSHEKLNYFSPFITEYLQSAQHNLKAALRPKPEKKKISKAEYTTKYNKIFDDYFKAISTDPIAIHKTADSWNWSGDDSDLFRIAKNKNTDLGTALLLFWQRQPQDYWLPYQSIAAVEAHYKKAMSLQHCFIKTSKQIFMPKGISLTTPKMIMEQT